jgi:hypothetical protein
MKRLVTAVAVVFVCLFILQIRSHAERPNEVSVFMKAKLTHSKNLIEGLALEDYDLLTKNAQQLALLSQESTWKVLQTVEYLRYSNEFRRSADGLRKAAQDKNLDGATLAYVQMTMNCVKCHKYVRQARRSP